MTKIEWTDLTWNPVTGCAKISAGCQNCYAEKLHKRLQGMGHEKYKHNFDFVRTHQSELSRVFVKKPSKIFVNSMGDLFHEAVPHSFVFEVIKVIVNNPQHVFQILTKRPERMQYYFTGRSRLPGNLWLGVTVENKKELHRIDTLRQIPAAVKFISFEPLLEDVGFVDLSGIDWVIVGAETGPGARFMEPEWVFYLRGVALVSRVPFFFKKFSKNSFVSDDRLMSGKMPREFPEVK